MDLKAETTSPDKSVHQMPGFERASWKSWDATERIREVCAEEEPLPLVRDLEVPA